MSAAKARNAVLVTEDAEVSSTIWLNGTGIGLYINRDRLVVFESVFNHSNLKGWGLETSVKVYDVSDRKAPVLMRDISVSGWYFSSRMIGDYVYAVVNYPAVRYSWDKIRHSGDEITVILPEIRIRGRVEKVSATEIRYADIQSWFDAFTTIIAINVLNDEQEPTRETILTGPVTCMYVSPNNIYIAIPSLPMRILRFFTMEKERTFIYRIRIGAGSITCEAYG